MARQLTLWAGLCLCLVLANAAYAHAVVTENSLHIKPVEANKAEQVTLSFNSQVELGLSQMFLVSKGDKHTALNMKQGDKQGQVVVSLPPLSLGEYALKFKVFAADGHLTEDVIHFSVAP